MDPDDDLRQLLRNHLGEPIPEGGTQDDTLFSDNLIDDLLLRHDEFGEASAEGWVIKSAMLSSLVDTVEGSTQRKLSDLHDHALAQAKFTAAQAEELGGVGPKGTVIRKISRRAV